MLNAKAIIDKVMDYAQKCAERRGKSRKLYAASHTEPKTVNGYDPQVIAERVKVMKEVVEFIKPNADQYDVYFGNGNQKLNGGILVNFIIAMSLPPILACKNCSKCMHKCYDACHVCFRDEVIKCRCINYAIYITDRKRYWKSLDDVLSGDCVPAVRINEGGDIEYEDLNFIKAIAKAHPMTHLLIYTKNYADVNRWCAKGKRLPKNTHLIFSAWEGVEMDNPYNFPTSHIIWKEGCHTSETIDGHLCGGNCSWCYINHTGCWALKKGEKVFFNAH